MLYLSFVVLLPIAALVAKSTGLGWRALWQDVTSPANLSALQLTVGASVGVVLINALFGSLLAWVLVRDQFPGKGAINALVDLPFALPTIVAGLTLVSLYGPNSPVGINVVYTRTAIVLALLFVTLPFVARAVQPVLITLDRDMEEAAAVLGANRLVIFRRVILPNLIPAILAGAGLAFARALGEFGAVTLISGNIPYKTQVMSLVIANDVLMDPAQAAALSLLLLVLSLAVLLIFSRLSALFTGHHDV